MAFSRRGYPSRNGHAPGGATETFPHGGAETTMTPNDLFALPNLSTHPWWDEEDRLADFFGQEFQSRRLDDVDAASLADPGPVFELKLQFVHDDDDVLSYYVVRVGDRPLGFLVETGDRDSRRAVTDLPGWEDAVAYLRSAFPPDPSAAREVIAADREVPALAGNYGCRTVTSGGRTFLARAGVCDAAGRLLFDPDAFRAAVDADLRATVPWDKPLPYGDAGADMRRAVARAVKDCLPGAEEAFVADHEMQPEPGRMLKVQWAAVVARTDEGTYLVGLPTCSRESRGPYWLDAVEVARVGGPELYAGLEAGHAVAEPPVEFEYPAP